MSGGRRAVRALLAVALVGASAAAALPAVAAGTSSAITVIKTVTREVRDTTGAVTSTDERQVTVTADVTEDLRSRQVVTLRWSGAHPSGNVYGAVSDQLAFARTEYPVVILQCRGDDTSTEAARQIRPETCWTTSGNTLTGDRGMGGAPSSGGSIYRHDEYATDADKAASVPSSANWPAACAAYTYQQGTESLPHRMVPFLGVDGREYWGAACKNYASEMSTGSALPPNEKVEVTRPDGSGFTHFEVRTAAENASLGCSADVPCAIVVIPIMGITCDGGDALCNEQGSRQAGSTWTDQPRPAYAVTGSLWASASNWRNRITIPITVAPTDTTCSNLTGRSVLQLYGSALLSDAVEQWAPAYCSRDDRFVLRINDQVEATAFRNLTAGYGSGVTATYPGVTGGKVELGYAPVAVSGFAIAFVIDVPNGGGQLESLKLTPRLLAKLLTASYPGLPAAAIPASRPDLKKNPGSLNLDPEFRELNPQLAVSSDYWNGVLPFFAALGSPSVPADVMTALTSYIAADQEAMDFIAGKPDPWGMTVNQSYLGISLPRADWPLQDAWTNSPANNPTDCSVLHPIPWFNRVLAPVSDLHRIAQDLQAATPEMLANYGVNVDTRVCQTTRFSALSQGSRAMIGLVTLADAEHYALPVAALRTTGTGTGGTFVAPTDASLAAGVTAMTSAGPGQPYVPDAAAMPDDAYPGTMVVHAAVPLSGLNEATAARAASFVKIATTEGQVSGPASGELPLGYLPIQSSGATAPLLAAANAVATAVAGQVGTMKSAPVPTATSTPKATVAAPPSTAGGVGLTNNTVAPGSTLPDTGTPDETSPAAVPGLPAPTPSATQATSAVATPDLAVGGPLRAALPVGLGVAALAGVAVPLVRRTPRAVR